MEPELMDFLTTYEVEPNHIRGAENASWDGGMFETYGNELAHVLDVNNERPEHVWTIVEVDTDDDDDTGLRVIKGFHHVNRFGYLISKNPCKQGHAALTFC